MDFSDALRAAKAGKRIQRDAWMERPGELANVWVELIEFPQLPDGRTPMPQLMAMYPHAGALRPFAGANWDLLGEDWKVLE